MNFSLNEDQRSLVAAIERLCEDFPIDYWRDHGRFSFSTVMPGRVAGPDGRLQAPHLLVSVMARGILTRLATRIYFESEPANADDPILELVPENRRGTLIARLAGSNRYVFDVKLQGSGETVFFDV